MNLFPLQDVRCPHCDRLLFKQRGEIPAALEIEIKCSCKEIVVVRAKPIIGRTITLFSDVVGDGNMPVHS